MVMLPKIYARGSYSVILMQSHSQRGRVFMNYDQLAKEILSRVGGIESVTSIIHCVTRLRFQLKDEGLSKTEWLRQE
jgi:PTS system beta-glucosides-specific IIC component